MKKFLLIACLLLCTVASLGALEIYEFGVASWYGSTEQGNLTANGEIFDNAAFTAAHPSLTFGTIIRVTNVSNKKSAVVRVNDRGPFSEGRIIDLSYAAGESIGMVETGLAPVIIEIISMPDTPETKYARWSDAAKVNIQIGSFGSRLKSEQVLMPFMDLGYTTVIQKSGDYYRCLIVGIPQHQVEEAILVIKKQGIKDFVLRNGD